MENFDDIVARAEEKRKRGIMYTFENFLQERHSENYTGLDDDMPDAYEHWTTELDGNELIEFADAYAKQLAEKLIEDTVKICDYGPTSIEQQLRAKWLKE